MRVRFDTPNGAPPPQSDLYFRGPVFGAFDGVEWHPLGARSGDMLQSSPSTLANLQVRGEPVRYEVTLEAHQRPWLLLLDAAATKPAISGMDTLMTQDLQWLTNRPITAVVRYKAESHPDFSHGPSAATPSLRAYTELPAGFNPRTLALAQQMRNDPQIAPNPAQNNAEALVNAALARLRTGGYTYTLEPGVYGQHTADEFWFDRKEGFCEHIASSFVVLMRALDIPARDLTQRVALAVLGRSPVERQLAFARERGWRHLPLYSSGGNDFNLDYAGEKPDGGDNPAFNVFRRDGDTIRHFWAAEMSPGTADPGQDPRGAPDAMPIWNLLDMTPEGRGKDWYPSLDY
eukprot:gene46709-62485_t